MLEVDWFFLHCCKNCKCMCLDLLFMKIGLQFRGTSTKIHPESYRDWVTQDRPVGTMPTNSHGQAASCLAFSAWDRCTDQWWEVCGNTGSTHPNWPNVYCNTGNIQILCDGTCVSDMLQAPSLDLARAVDLIHALQETLEDCWAGSFFGDLWQQTMETAKKCNSVIKHGCLCRALCLSSPNQPYTAHVATWINFKLFAPSCHVPPLPLWLLQKPDWSTSRRLLWKCSLSCLATVFFQIFRQKQKIWDWSVVRLFTCIHIRFNWEFIQINFEWLRDRICG